MNSSPLFSAAGKNIIPSYNSHHLLFHLDSLSSVNITYRGNLLSNKNSKDHLLVWGIGGSQACQVSGVFKNLFNDMKFHYLSKCNLNIVSLPLLERLFVVIKDNDNIICTSKIDDNNVVTFTKDINGFYVYKHILMKNSRYICNSSTNLVKRNDELHMNHFQSDKPLNINITAMSLSHPQPDSLQISPPSPTLTPTPEREIENNQIHDNIGLEDDEDTEDDEFLKTLKKNDNNKIHDTKNNNNNNNNNNNHSKNNKSWSVRDNKIFKIIDTLHKSCDHTNDISLRRILKLINKSNGRTWLFNTKIINRDFNNYLKQRGTCDGCTVARIKGMANQKRFPTSNNNTSLTQIHSDIFYTLGMSPWVICVDALTGLVSIFSVKKKNKFHMLMKCIQPLVSIYASRGINIDAFLSDDEAIYRSLNEELKKLKILPVQSAPGEHNSIAERNIQTVKKKAMSIIESLEYNIRSFMIAYLLRWVADTINIIPDGEGKSPFFNLYKYHPSSDLLKFPFGEIAIFKNPYPTNILNNVQKGIVIGRKLASVDSLIVFLFENNTIVVRSANSSETMSAEGKRREIEKYLPNLQNTINNNSNKKKKKNKAAIMSNEIFEDEIEETEMILSNVIDEKEVTIQLPVEVMSTEIITPMTEMESNSASSLQLTSYILPPSSLSSLPSPLPALSSSSSSSSLHEEIISVKKSLNDVKEKSKMKRKKKKGKITALNLSSPQQPPTSSLSSLSLKIPTVIIPSSTITSSTISSSTNTTNTTTSPTSPHTAVSKNIFIEKLHATRMIKGKKQILVEWKGHEDNNDWTWEAIKKVLEVYDKRDINRLPTFTNFQKSKGNIDTPFAVCYGNHTSSLNHNTSSYSYSYPKQSSLKKEPTLTDSPTDKTNNEFFQSNSSYSYSIHTTSSPSPKHTASLFHPINVGAETMSLKAAMKSDRTLTLEGLDNELQGILQQNVCLPVYVSSLTTKQREEAIPSHIMCKEKIKDDGKGNVTKIMKSRLVAGGDKQTDEMFKIEDSTSGVMRSESLNIILAIAAHENLPLTILDIKQAFLWGTLTDEIYMYINSQIAEHFCRLNPEWSKFRTPEGKLYVRLLKPLYGLIQAPKIFYDHLSGTLGKMGFVCVSGNIDSGLFKKQREDGSYIILGVHVDDLGLVSTNEEGKWFEDELNKVYGKFGNVTVQRGDKVKWLGIEIERDWVTKSFSLSQSKFIDESIIKKFGVTHHSSYPAAPELFLHDVEEDKLMEKKLDLKFISALMSAAWLQKTKPEIALAISYLSTRVTKVTSRDRAHLLKLMGYINFSRHHKLTISPKSLNVILLTDASYAINPGCLGQTGIVTAFGVTGQIFDETNSSIQSIIHSSTHKQSFVHTSSAGAEIDAQSEGIKHLLWARYVMKELGFEQKGPSTVYQDNMSAIIMGLDGKGSFKNSKHMPVRFFFIKQQIDNGTVKLQHCPTEFMVADILTKPLQASLFRRMKAAILNNNTIVSE